MIWHTEESHSWNIEIEQNLHNPWGIAVDAARQRQLESLLRSQESHDSRRAFTGIRLTGADVFWLAVLAITKSNGGDVSQAQQTLTNPPDIGSSDRTYLGSFLSNLHLNGAILQEAHLENAILREVHFEGADLTGAYLTGADLGKSNLKSATLQGAHLERAYLREAHLENAVLLAANLRGADLSRAYVAGGYLREAHLEGTLFHETSLQGANLGTASFDKTSRLNGAHLNGAVFDQVIFDNTNLAVVDWSEVVTLGDELTARQAKDFENTPKNAKKRLMEYEAAVRAHRQVAVALRAQGLNEHADRFAYRSQVLQRQVLRRRRKVGAYIFSLFLDAIAGYGYEPIRSLLAYIAIIASFTGLYLLASHFAAPHLSWDEALVLSISSFHGRGFFTQNITLGDVYARVAATEAVIGLFIEISFIATLTQRFFAK